MWNIMTGIKARFGAGGQTASASTFGGRDARVFWIDAPLLAPGRLGVMPRPMPDHFDELKRQGVNVVVSVMEADKSAEIGLGDEAERCTVAGMSFITLPIVDHSVPSAVTPVARLSRQIRTLLESGQGVAVHCFAGLGRSPLVCAAVLIDHDLTTFEACDLITSARGVSVPETTEQTDWLLAYERHQRGW